MNKFNIILKVSDWCQDGYASSPMITEVKHLELNQFLECWVLL